MPCPASITQNQVDLTYYFILFHSWKKLTRQTFVTGKNGPPLPMAAYQRRVAELADRHGDLWAKKYPFEDPLFSNSTFAR